MQHETEQHGANAKGYEPSDARLGPIVAFTIGLTVVVLAAAWAMTRVFEAFEQREQRADSAPHPMATRTEPPAPRLQRETSADLLEHSTRMERLATSYDWIDRDAGVVRIPVERAMELTLERGLPTRQERR